MPGLLVQAYKYNGAKHYSYPVQLVSQTEDVVITYGAPGRLLNHPGRQLVNTPMTSEVVEFHFTNRPYNVAAVWEEDGSFRRYYCNLMTPAKVEGEQLTFIDLDLDLIVHPDYTFFVDDEDEFEEHQLAWAYPPEVIAMVRDGLAELIQLVESRAFPFDGSAARIREGCRRPA